MSKLGQPTNNIRNTAVEIVVSKVELFYALKTSKRPRNWAGEQVVTGVEDGGYAEKSYLIRKAA